MREELKELNERVKNLEGESSENKSKSEVIVALERDGGAVSPTVREGVKHRKQYDLFSNQKLEISIALSIKTLERDARFSRKFFGIRHANFQKKSR